MRHFGITRCAWLNRLGLMPIVIDDTIREARQAGPCDRSPVRSTDRQLVIPMAMPQLIRPA